MTPEKTVAHVHVARGRQYQVEVPVSLAKDAELVEAFIAEDVERQDQLRAAAEADDVAAAPAIADDDAEPAAPKAPTFLTREES